MLSRKTKLLIYRLIYVPTLQLTKECATELTHYRCGTICLLLLVQLYSALVAMSNLPEYNLRGHVHSNLEVTFPLVVVLL